MPSTYEPSGEVEPSFFAYAAAGLGVSVGLGWLYQLLLAWIPLIYVSFLITLAFGFGLYWVMATASEQGRCRHPWLAGGVGAAVGLVGVAASHYFAYLAALETTAQSYAVSVEAARDQFGFWDFIGARVDQGWSISRSFSDGGGMPISGVFVYLVWLVEAGVLAGSGAYGGWVLANAPYCESCDRWTEVDFAITYPDPSEEVVSTVISADRVETLVDPPIETAIPGPAMLRYEVYVCPDCASERYVDVVTERVGEDDELEEVIQWEYVALTGAQLATLEELPDRYRAEVEDGSESGEPESDGEAVSGTEESTDGDAEPGGREW